MLPIGGEPTDGALDATWSPAEAGFLVLSFDGGPPTPIAVPIDPTPLDALLSPGEPVRFTRTSEWSLDQRESLRLTRPDGSPLLEIQNITAYGSSADLPAFEELGVALRALPECEGLQSHSPDCAPEIRRYFAIEVGDGPSASVRARRERSTPATPPMRGRTFASPNGSREATATAGGVLRTFRRSYK